MPVPLCFPWRSVWFARAVTLIALVIGVPLFLRTPPWCDITLYQMAARNILNGGVHYQGIFDTNLPGFVWLLTAIQWLFGPSVVAVRFADLAIVCGIVLLADHIAKRGGASLASRWWAFAGVAVFYPFTIEMSHAQRDIWMTLPSLGAVALRVRRGMREATQPAFRESLLEGVLWGFAVWIKPHIVVMAASVWLLSAWRIASTHSRRFRALAFDFLGNVCGGLLIGVLGLGLLFATGAWKPFLDVFTNWNPGYLDLVRIELKSRTKQELFWFPPWSLGIIVTVPLAFISMVDMAPWAGRGRANSREHGPLSRWLPRLLWDKTANADARFARGLLGGLYLVWTLQSFFLQRGFEYAHVPETLLMLAVWASHRWAWTLLMLLYLTTTSSLWFLAENNESVRAKLEEVPPKSLYRYFPRHPMFATNRLRAWPTCWRFNLTDNERYALWDELKLHPPHEASMSWVELAEVAEFLRSQNVGDGEVIAWFDSPHAVYLMLGIEPGMRFMHVYTAISIGKDKNDEDGRIKVMRELANTPRARFVINDLEWVVIALSAETTEQRNALLAPAQSPQNLLPPTCPHSKDFPFNQPTVFRTKGGTGRYIVHTIVTRENSK